MIGFDDVKDLASKHPLVRYWTWVGEKVAPLVIGTPTAADDVFQGPSPLPPEDRPENSRPSAGRPLREAPLIEIENPSLVLNYQAPSISVNASATYVRVNNNYQIVLAPQIQTRIEIPPRRLPKEADGQTAFDTPAGRSIDIKQELAARSFGNLLHKPLTAEEETIFVHQTEEIQDKLEEKIAEGQVKFASWLVSQHAGGLIEQSESDNKLDRENEAIEFWQEIKAKYPNADEPIEFWDASSLISPGYLKGFQGEIGFLFGQEALHFVAQEFFAARGNAFQKVTGLIPIKYKIKKVRPDIRSTYKENESLFNNNSNALSQRIYQILGGGLWSTSGTNTGFIFNPEAEFKELMTGGFTEGNGDGIKEVDESKPKRIRNLIDLINYNASTFYYRLGLVNYPQHLPKDLTLNDKKMRDEFEENHDKDDEYDPELYLKISNQTQYNSWFLKQFDGLIGQFPIEINIEDSDLMKVGDQKLELKFPNVAETLAELLGLSLNVKAYLEANLNASMRTLAEVGSTKKQAITHYYLTAALQDYLGFKSKKKTIEVPFLYNPAAGSSKEEPDSLANALKTTKQKVEIEESDDENTLEKHMATLIESARITKAVHWRKTDAPDLKNWKEFIKSAVDFATGEAEEEETDLDDLFKDIEEGFINTTAIPDKKNPYGRPFEQRPKIRNLKPEEET
ncbi:MAG: hypothetical protein ACRC2V_02080 [Xenococcaceae cyanobacterium]